MYGKSFSPALKHTVICLGCTEDGFPDKFSPFYKIEYGYQTDDKPFEVGPL
jgi:Ni,Fe-hydrogenase I small subunit